MKEGAVAWSLMTGSRGIVFYETRPFWDNLPTLPTFIQQLP
jgi:hypothetical protein